MHRLFVAIPLPGQIRARLFDLMGGVAGARWLSEDQLHLTVRFIGEVDRHSAEDVHAALAGVRHPRFEIALNGIGAFDRRGEATALWVGVAPHEPLKALHRKVDQAITRAGLDPERRAYVPHITLARIKRGAGPIRSFVEGGGIGGPPFPIDEFRLYESRLTPEGPLYETMERYSLT
jgi:2'-5' RNA ligase